MGHTWRIVWRQTAIFHSEPDRGLENLAFQVVRDQLKKPLSLTNCLCQGFGVSVTSVSPVEGRKIKSSLRFASLTDTFNTVRVLEEINMQANTKNRIFAATLPILMIVAGYNFPLLFFILPVIFYFATRKFGLDFASLTALRIFDLIVSIILFAIVFGLLYSGLQIAARDAAAEIPFVTDGFLKSVFKLIVGVYSNTEMIPR